MGDIGKQLRKAGKDIDRERRRAPGKVSRGAKQTGQEVGRGLRSLDRAGRANLRGIERAADRAGVQATRATAQLRNLRVTLQVGGVEILPKGAERAFLATCEAAKSSMTSAVEAGTSASELAGALGEAASASASRATKHALAALDAAAQGVTTVIGYGLALPDIAGRGFGLASRVLLNPIVEEVKRWPVYQWIIDNIADLFMDRPKIIRCGTQYAGTAVYYVNGILTTRFDAKIEGNTLADHLRRPVNLIHNRTHLEQANTGTAHVHNDFFECIYDRLWPQTLGGGIPVQLNTTTRQLTHVFYHEPQVAIVSHSQGCLQVRNAAFTAALFRGERKVGRGFYWVATGVPLSNAEVWPRPQRFHKQVNAGDSVAQVIGVHGGAGTLDSVLRKHNFLENYLSQVQAEWLRA